MIDVTIDKTLANHPKLFNIL